ncbi:MAG: hypothetical protein CSA86_01085 [Arcobacter sp.]|nr:MAG: hypothetical protein CSA86_01085 [Arcobacter sp.]
MEFLNQQVFYLMLIPLLLLFVLIITSKSSVQKYFSKEIVEKLKVGNQFLGKNSRNSIFFFVLILFIIALGRPVINKKEQNIKQSLIPLVIALDVSTSMMATDIYPNRISLAKKKLQEIIKIAKNATIGVVLFAKDSFILSPVTEDFVSLKFIVDNLDTNLDFTNGSNLFSTLEATKYMLEDYKVKNLIVLSDGGNNSNYEEELQYIKENDIVVYSIGLATKEGSPIPKNGSYLTNSSGDIVTVKLNESIKTLSLQSGGGYIDYTLDMSDVKAIINRINIQSSKEELNLQKVKVYTELFYYPLAVGIFLLLIALSSFPTIRSKNSIKNLLWIAIVISFSATPTKSFSYTFNFENIDKATKAYKNKDYKTASQFYRKVNTSNESLYNLGNALYKEKKYKAAIDVYNKIVTNNKELGAKKLHNIGNSYVKSNNLEKAKEYYEKSLKIKNDKETKENLDAVNKELEKKKKKNNKQNNKDQNKNKDQKKNNKQDNNDKDKNNNKDNKDKNKDQKKKNNQDNKKKNKKDKEQNKNNKDKNKNKEQNKDKKDKDKKKEQAKDQKTNTSKNVENKDELSNLEEKKWMKLLKNQPTPLFIQKVKTNKESKYDENQPW